jgi:hypothetical protein
VGGGGGGVNSCSESLKSGDLALQHTTLAACTVPCVTPFVTRCCIARFVPPYLYGADGDGQRHLDEAGRERREATGGERHGAHAQVRVLLHERGRGERGGECQKSVRPRLSVLDYPRYVVRVYET